jgi:hypothetical protein
MNRIKNALRLTPPQRCRSEPEPVAECVDGEFGGENACEKDVQFVKQLPERIEGAGFIEQPLIQLSFGDVEDKILRTRGTDEIERSLAIKILDISPEISKML